MMMTLVPKCGGRQLKPPANGVHPILKWVWCEILRQDVSLQSVAQRAGFEGKTIRNWWNGKSSPALVDVQAVVNALGYQLVITALKDPE
jgi:hypothetical protein